jgi:ABC-type multidrug transport system ATPase subunit
MNESVLEALMRLFAMVANVNEEGFARNERDVVSEYLQRQFSNELVDKYLAFFDVCVQEYHREQKSQLEIELDRAGNHDVNIIGALCEQLNAELERQQKMLVVLYLLDFIHSDEVLSKQELEFVNIVAKNLNIPEEEFRDASSFSFDEAEKIKGVSNLLFIDNGDAPRNKKIKHIHIDKIEGRINVLHINSTNTYVLRYDGSMDLLLNGHSIRPNRTYIWALGSVVKNPRFGSIYYTWIAGRFIQATTKTSFVFEAIDIEYVYGNGPNGIKSFSLNEESGRLIGIIGGSGSGKSTLLKLLSGILKPKRGSIRINGFDIHKNHKELEGVIGYVPQDDFLIKELTVFENLMYNARLSFSHYSPEMIRQLVDEALLNFDLVEARNLRVGDALNTYLSGGQRKRLNIALELIREPSILFVDEPTSGLSSADSEKVMNLLKRQTFKGKLVFANIHQPSSEIFRLLDKLLVVDQGGRVIYYGNPLDAMGYFKRISHYVDAEESECLTCGNIDVDQILRNIEARVVDVNGRLTRKRRILPEEWHTYYIRKIEPNIRRIRRPYAKVIPKSLYRIPGRWKQVKIFFGRDIWAKFKNQQYLVITMLEAPVLALLLSFYTRSSKDVSGLITEYNFGMNANIPAFLFMAVIVALFLGLVISAEEIFRDRKLLERERFLNLSRFSYLSSKISILFIISALQMLFFVIIGNTILEIKSMTWRYFLILFSASCWGNLIGLNISSGFKSVITIYILIPLILIPQLLFSGVIVDFHNLNKAIYSAKTVPAVGELMTSRWAYEALMVTQFKDNPFQNKVFPAEMHKSQSMFKKAYVIPKLQAVLKEQEDAVKKKPNAIADHNEFRLILNETKKIGEDLHVNTDNLLSELPKGIYSNSVAGELRIFLDQAWKKYHAEYLNAVKESEAFYTSMELSLRDQEDFAVMKNKYVNKQLSEILRNENELVEYIVYDNEIVRLRDPVYTLPWLNNGRAHFYAPYKKIMGMYIDTFWFNLLVIWIFTGLWFIILYYDLLRKLITYFENLQLQRFNRRILRILKQQNENR